MMHFLAFSLVLAILGSVTQAKIYDRCELLNELRNRYQFPEEQLADWICLIRWESNYNTSAVGTMNWDSKDHGLFQISDKYWCDEPKNACWIDCAKLEDDDITDDVDCVKKIYCEHEELDGNGFMAWVAWSAYCQGDLSEYIAGCDAQSASNSAKNKGTPAAQSQLLSKEQQLKYGRNNDWCLYK